MKMTKNINLSASVIANIIQFIIVLILLTQTINQCSRLNDQEGLLIKQQDKLDSLNFIVRASQFQPRLKLLNNPKIINMSVDFKGNLMQNKINPNSVIGDSIAIVPTFSLKVKMEIALENVGTSIAKIFIIAHADTLTNIPILRNLIKDTSLVQPDENYFFDERLKIEILPGDSTILYVEPYVNPMRDSINIHLMILYENGLGNVFDTYIWGKYINIPQTFLFGFSINQEDSTRVPALVIPPSEKEDFKYAGGNVYYYTYDKNNSKILMQLLKSLKKDLTDSKK